MRGLLGLMWPDRAEHSNRSVRFLQQRVYRMSSNRNFVFLFNRVAKSGVAIYDNSNSWLLLDHCCPATSRTDSIVANIA